MVDLIKKWLNLLQLLLSHGYNRELGRKKDWQEGKKVQWLVKKKK